MTFQQKQEFQQKLKEEKENHLQFLAQQLAQHSFSDIQKCVISAISIQTGVGNDEKQT